MDRPFPSLWGRSGAGAADPFASLQREMSRVLDDLGRGFDSLAQLSTTLSPRIDVKETRDAVEVHAELPGVDENDVDLQLSPEGLTIRGDKKAEQSKDEERWRVVERNYGSFLRQIPLPFQADPAKVEASFNKGVLKIVVAKPENEGAGQTKIQIRSA